MKDAITKYFLKASPILLLSPLITACSLTNVLTTNVLKSCSTKFSPQKLYKKTLPSVAVITVGNSIGSAFVVKHENGKTYLMTNSHVTGGNMEVTVYWSDKTKEKGLVVGDLFGDQETDIALVEVEGIRGKVLKIETSTPNIGEDVIVIGAPRGLDFTMTRGIVSQIRKDKQIIQVDAPVNPGNSGGPMFNSSGCVSGMVTFKKEDSEGLNFAIAPKNLKAFIDNPRHARMDDIDTIEKAPPFFFDFAKFTKVIPDLQESTENRVRYNQYKTGNSFLEYYFSPSSITEVGDWKFVNIYKQVLNDKKQKIRKPWKENRAINCRQGLIIGYEFFPNEESFGSPDRNTSSDEVRGTINRKMGAEWWHAFSASHTTKYKEYLAGTLRYPTYDELADGSLDASAHKSIETWRSAVRKFTSEGMVDMAAYARDQLKDAIERAKTIHNSPRELNKRLLPLFTALCRKSK